MSSPEERAVALADLVVRLATGDYAARAQPTDARDELDAVAVGLNMLAETLQLEHEARGRAEALLHDEVDGYERAPGMFCSVESARLTIVKCNATLAAALQLSKEQVVGRPVEDLLIEGDRANFRSAIRAMRDDPTTVVRDFHLVSADESTLPVLVSGSVALAGSASERVRLIFRDVSAERSLEAQLRHSQKMDAIGRLASGVAHDLNNILAVIHGSESFLEDSLGQDHPGQPDVVAIRQAADRAARLTGQLLSFGSNRMAKPRVIDLCDFLRESRDILERSVGESVEIEWVLHDAPLPIRIDPTQLTQVVLNLALNSRDAMQAGGRLRIEAMPAPASPRRPPSACLRLSDEGEGMPADVLDRAFEPFFTTKAVGKGSGLGLSVCFGIVRQGGGTLEIDSQVGRGTTVRVVLPLSEQKADRSESPSPVRSHQGRGEKILVVDDADDVLAMMSRLISRAGYEVIPADSGARALEIAFEHGGIDLLVTDVVMPKMSGPELAQALWRHEPELPVIFVSGYSGDRLDPSTIQRHNVRLLPKPFRAHELSELIRQSLAAELPNDPT